MKAKKARKARKDKERYVELINGEGVKQKNGVFDASLRLCGSSIFPSCSPCLLCGLSG
jgi:hypothetical protein